MHLGRAWRNIGKHDCGPGVKQLGSLPVERCGEFDKSSLKMDMQQHKKKKGNVLRKNPIFPSSIFLSLRIKWEGRV